MKGQTPAMTGRHRAFELYDWLRLAFSWESGICIRILLITKLVSRPTSS
jgi:hypothetical protein